MIVLTMIIIIMMIRVIKISMIIMLVTMILIIITVLGSIVLHTQNLLFICSPFEVCIKISKSSQA